MNLDQLREFCALHWNPIGVPMEPKATESELGYPPLPSNEYDAYLSEMLRLLGQGGFTEELAR